MKGTSTLRAEARFFVDLTSRLVTRMFALLSLAAAVCLLCASLAVGQTTDNWKGGSGNWSNSADWSAGVPNGNFNVFIDNGNAAASPVTLDMNAAINNLTIDSDDSLAISDSRALTVNGSSISNAGNMSLNSGGNATELIIGSSNVTLSGGGTLTMGNSANNFIFCSLGSDKFTNQETIQGAGNLGDGQMTLVNSGTINANAGVGQNVLNIQTSGGTTNTGTLEATNGTLILNGASGGNFTNTGGTIKASGSGSVVELVSGVSVTGGTLTTSSGGVIETPASNTATLNGVTNSGTYSVNDSANTILQGTITNNSSMQLNSAGNASEFRISGNVTLTGSGSVTMSNSGNNFILGNTSTSDKLTNQQTIQGAGNIGDGQMTLVNSGTIDANAGAGQNTLVIQTSGGTTNTGTLEATNGSTLVLTGASGGNFTNTGGTIQATGAGSVVALESGVSVTGGTLTTSSGGVIETPASNTATLNGVTNSGTYSVNDSANTILQGTITNNSSMQLNSGGNASEFRISGNVTLTGSGSVTMSNNGNNFILGNSTGTEVLTNQQTIQGAGNIGDGFLTLTNQGTVNANQGLGQSALIIQPGSGGVTNTATLEATNGSTMVLDGGTFTNTNGSTNGTIQAVGTNSVVALENGVTIAGGTLTDSSGGIIETPAGNTATLDGTTHTLTNSGTYSLNDSSTTVLLGTINNTGTLQLNSGGNATILKIGNSTNNVSLTGGGTVTLSNNGNNFILGASGSNSLTNVNNTIQGAGNIGDGQMTLINQSVIDANAGSGQNSLTIQTSGGTTNTGTLEATNGSTLVLSGFGGGSFTNTGGTIEALNSTTGTAVVALESGASITGGTLTTTGNGVIETPAGNTSTLNGVTNSGTYSVNDSANTILQGTITNNSSMQLNSGGNATEFRVSGNVTLTGSGSVTMSNSGNNFILGNTATSDTLTNKETIQGAGNIGDGQMTLVNSGTTGIIDANAGSGQNALTIQTSGGTTNTGTLEATNGSALVLTGASGGAFTNTGGTIKATGTGSVVELVSGVTVTGGTLTTSSGGLLETTAGNTATLSGVTNSGTYSVNDSAVTILSGTDTNSGTLELNSGGNATEFRISGNTTLSGSGTVTLSNNANNFILGNSTGTEILTSANTIQGAGNIGDAFMGFVNTGKVIANQSNTLFIDPSSAAFNNKGTVQANTGSTLDIIGGAGTFINLNSSTSTLTGGTYIADGTIQFGTSNATANDITTNAASITLSGTSSQIIDQFGNNALANLNTNASGGSFTINSGRNFTTAGNFTNNGTLTVGSTTSKFDVNGNLTNFSGTTLTGGTYNLTGTLQFNGANIVTNAANITLTGASGQIIDQSSNNGLANFATNASNGKFTIAGTRTFTTKGNFTNNGTLTTSNTGSKFDVNGNLTNFSGTTLTGGTYNMTGTLQFNGANIVTNAANITLTGTSSQIIDQSSNNGLANFATNASGASFTINSGRNFTTAGNFTNNGTLTVGTSTSKFDVNGNLTNFSGSTLTGGTYNITGTLQFNGANIVTNAANLTLSGTSSQIIDQSSNNGLANFATNASGGSFTINSNRTFTTAGSFSNAGTFTVASGSTFTVGGSGSLTQTAGRTTDDGSLSVGSLFSVQAGSLFGKGTLTGNVTSSGTITPGDSSTKTGILTDKGTYTQNSSGTLDISIGGNTAGTNFDELNPTTATLNGTLNISLINGFVPAIGKTYKILNYNSETGTFTTVNGLSINSSEHFTITYQGTDVLLTVVSGPAVPFLHIAPSPWSNRLRLPVYGGGIGLLDGYAGFSSFAESQLPGFRGERAPLLHQSALSDGLSAYRSVSAMLQTPPTQSMLRWGVGAGVETARGFSIPNSQSWVAGHGVPLSNALTYSEHRLATSHPEFLLAKPQFLPASVVRTVPGLSQAIRPRTPLAEAPSIGARFFHIGSQVGDFASLATAPNSFLRHPVVEISRSVAASAAGLPQPRMLDFSRNIGAASVRGLVPCQCGVAQPIVNRMGLGAGAVSASYRATRNYSDLSAGSRAFSRVGNGNSKLPSTTARRGAAGFRGPSVTRSFSVSLGNLTSKPKLGFAMQ